MKLENTNLNIPSTSVSNVTSILCSLYANAYKANIPFKSLPTPFLWGPAGVGKSEGIRELADALSLATGATVHVNDVRLLLFSPIDLRGVPVADERRQFTDWLKPRIFDMDAGEGTINILFLDELSAAPQSVQAAAYQICLDRKVGEHALPDNCIVIAAGNRTTDQSVAYKMPKALCNRLMHFNITPDFDSWKTWAICSGIDPRIIAYLSFDTTKLFVEPDSSDMAYPTPRSWAFVSSLIKTTGKEPEGIHSLISSCIGIGVALEFEAYCKVYHSLPDIDSIFKGTCSKYPRSHDELYALVSSLSFAVISRNNSITSTALENCCVYANHFPADFAMSFYKGLMSDSDVKLKLMKCSAAKEWLTKNKHLL